MATTEHKTLSDRSVFLKKTLDEALPMLLCHRKQQKSWLVRVHGLQNLTQQTWSIRSCKWWTFFRVAAIYTHTHTHNLCAQLLLKCAWNCHPCVRVFIKRCVYRRPEHYPVTLSEQWVGETKKVSTWVLTCWWLPYSDVWENKRCRNSRTKVKFENLQDHFHSWVICYFLDVQDLVQHAQGDLFFYLVCNKWSNNQHTEQKKKRAIVQ